MKTFIVVLLATLSAAIGETLISYGMKRNGQVDLTELSQCLKLIFSVVRNPYIFSGVVLLGIFFFLYLAALSWADLSFVLPLTALSFIFAAILAKFFLKEDISWYRWAGTLVIIIGIVLVGLDRRQQSVDYRRNTQDNGTSQGVHDTKRSNF
ncbi:MAG TPA: DMT family transporter [Thermodesulfovibrionales bacterium]|nr:DMT family transporter [Thermodesulfovibrionales bacterium]